MLTTVDLHEHFIKMPSVAEAPSSVANPSRVLSSIMMKCVALEALNDHKALRCDVAMQTAVGVDREVASAPTLCWLDPWAYLRDVLTRIHNHPSHRIDELLSHRWQPG